MHLSWSAPSNGGAAITGYKVYRGTTSGNETLLTTLGNVTSFDDTGVSNGTTYYYKVSAVNVGRRRSLQRALGHAGRVADRAGSSDPHRRAAASGVVHLAGARRPTAAPRSPATRSTAARRAASETLLTTLGNVTGFDDTAVSNGTTYYYKVSAVNSVGEGALSNERSATPAVADRAGSSELTASAATASCL